jgi:hypothetical protein
MYPRDISSSANARRTMSLTLQNSAVASAVVAKIISGGTANVMRGVLIPSFLFAIALLLLCRCGTAFRFQCGCFTHIRVIFLEAVSRLKGPDFVFRFPKLDLPALLFEGDHHFQRRRIGMAE